MKYWGKIISISFFLFFLSCAQEEKEKTKAPTSPSKHSSIDSSSVSVTQLSLLIFNVEQKMELWSGQNKQLKLLARFKLKDSGDWPIGKYEVEDQNQFFQLLASPKKPSQTNQYAPTYPNTKHLTISAQTPAANTILLEKKDFSLLKQHLANSKATRAWIFPNDSRQAGTALRACYSCPHWMAELYAQLELELEAFQF